MDQKEAHLISLEKDIAILVREIERKTKVRDELNRHLVFLRESLEEQRIALANIEPTRKSYEMNIELLKRQQEEEERKMEGARIRHKEEYDSLERDITRMRNEVMRLEARKNELDELIGGKEKEIRELNDRYVKMRRVAQIEMEAFETWKKGAVKEQREHEKRMRALMSEYRKKEYEWGKKERDISEREKKVSEREMVVSRKEKEMARKGMLIAKFVGSRERRKYHG